MPRIIRREELTEEDVFAAQAVESRGVRRHIGPVAVIPEEWEIETLLRKLERRKPEYMCLILCATDSGMRAGEVHKARISDFRLDQGRVYVRASKKRGSDRWSVCTERQRRAIEYTSQYGCKDLLSRGKCYGWLGWFLRSLLDECGLDSRINWNSLRHRFATRLIDSGMGLADVSALLGHAWISSTAYYIHATRDRFHRAADILGTPEAEPREITLRVLDGGKGW